MVAPPISPEVNKAITGDVVHKPADFVGVGLNHHLVFGFGVNHPDDSTISVHDVLVDERRDVVEPHLLPSTFESSGGRVVEIGLKEFLRGAGDDFFLGHVQGEIKVNRRDCGGARVCVQEDGCWKRGSQAEIQRSEA